MGKILKIFSLNLRRQLESPKFYLALVLLVCAVMVSLKKLPNCLEEYGLNVQSGELFIFLTSDWFSQLMIVFSMLLLIGDAPFFHEGMEILLMRTDKKTWLKAQLLFMFCMVVIAMIVLQVSLLAVTVGHITWNNEWSDYITLVTRLQGGEENLGMELGSSMLPLAQGSPYLLFGIAFLYSILLYTYLGMWGLVANLSTGHSYASLIVTFFLVLRFALFNLFYSPQILLLSPMNLVDLTTQSITPHMLIYTILFFTIQIMILIWVSGKILKKRDICKLR